MTDTTGPIGWGARLEDAFGEEAVPETNGSSPKPVFDADLIPELDEYEPDPLDEVLDRVDILDAYRRWCGKMEPNPGGRTEGIKISCPNPAHPDANPSAWVNTDNQTWYCGACDIGGDKYDIAAWKFGFSVPGYKNKDQFPKLRVEMATNLGFTVTPKITGGVYLSEPEPVVAGRPLEPAEVRTETVPAPVALAPDHSAPVISGPFGEIKIGADYDDEQVRIDWESLIPKHTFLYEWMFQNSQSDEPNEYLFWLGLVALGAAAGNNIRLWDDPPVRPNLFVCLVGSSGSRKSRAVGRLKHFLEEVLPYDADDDGTTGTLSVAAPGSGEALVDVFSKPVYDEMAPKMVVGYRAVRGLITFNELTDLTERTNRSGSILKPTLMQFFDSADRIAITSRGHGEARADNHFCQVITTTQPKLLRDNVERSDVDSGFLNRWIFVKSVEKPRRALGGKKIDLTTAKSLLGAVRVWCTPRSIALVGPNLDRFEEIFYSELVPVLDQDNGILERLDLMFKKIVLLFAINEKTTHPDVDLLNRAANLLKYLIHTYEVTDKNIGHGPFEDCCESVQQAITDFTALRKHDPSLRDIRAMVPKRFNAELLYRAIKALTTVGVLTEYLDPKTKNPRYKVAA